MTDEEKIEIEREAFAAYRAVLKEWHNRAVELGYDGVDDLLTTMEREQ